MPNLWDLDPLTGIRTRAARAPNRCCERDAPGDMIVIDVEKLGRIPDGGSWRADELPLPGMPQRTAGFGFDYVHVAVALDDHSQLAFVEVHTDDKGLTCARTPTRAAAFLAAERSPG